MKAAALNPLPKKLKFSSTCKLAVGVWLAWQLGISAASAEDISSPPAAGSHTREEQAQPQAKPPDLPESTKPDKQAQPQTKPPVSSDAHPSDDSRNLPQPDVNIIHEKDRTVEEYRINGKLRYVKITPSKGKPYYLVDRDGDGVLETRYSDLKGPPPVNQWLLFTW
jgi:hypothetical protein